MITIPSLHAGLYYYSNISNVNNGLIPYMTSNTNPYGVVTYSSEEGSYLGYYAFSGNPSLTWNNQVSDSNPWLQYQFTRSVNITSVQGWVGVGQYNLSQLTILGSNDNLTWTQFYASLVESSFSFTSSVSPVSSYLYIRWQNTGNQINSLGSLQVFGH